MMVRSRQASRTDFMPRTRAPDGCGRAREPNSRVRHPLAFDWPVAARLKPTMSLTSWPINPWSRIWNLLTKPSNGDGDLGRCSRTHGSRSSASRADGEDASTSLASLGERLAKFKTPKRVFIVDSLPRNAMGKVQKAMLRETYEGIYVIPTASRQIPAKPAGPNVGSIDRTPS
jgi:hypothetical protein